ncbi:MAG: glycosyltransferase [Vicinamibacterales bacterium]
MHIAFDGTTLRPGRTGVGYYTEHLLRATATLCSSDALTVISNQPVETTEPLPEHVGRHISGSRLPRFVWMQLQAPRVVRRLRADVVHFTNGMMPAAASAPAVVTIHDMSL